jgi:hypothetical protein
LSVKYPWLFSVKDKVQTATSQTNIHKTRNLYVTGHLDGTISFWDASCPLLLQIFTIKQQVTPNHNYYAEHIISMHMIQKLSDLFTLITVP